MIPIFHVFRASVVAINTKDAPNGRVFTLLHELAHIVLRKGGDALCDIAEPDAPATEVERFCNHIAGAVLVPRESLLARPEVRHATRTSMWTDAEKMASRLGGLYSQTLALRS